MLIAEERAIYSFLPELEWEEVTARKLLPPELRDLVGAPTQILRVSRTVVAKMQTKHSRELPQFEQLDRHLRNWERVGPDPRYPDNPRYRDIWNIFFRDQGRYFVVVIGKDRSGSFNLVSVFSVDKVSYFERRWELGTWHLRT